MSEDPKIYNRPVNRSLLQLIAKHIPLSAQQLERAFDQSGVYPEKSKLLNWVALGFIAIGFSFLLAGIIFFFAYNWADLHKFAKMGIILVAILSGAGVFWWRREKMDLTNQFILTFIAVMIGVLYAVYGQIYQTGANAYDFFMAWVLSISLLVFISKFKPLWLIYLLLINTTLFLFAGQVLRYWDWGWLMAISFLLNSFVLIYAEYWYSKKEPDSSRWFQWVVGISVLTLITWRNSYAIFDLSLELSFWVNLLLWMAGGLAGYWYYRNHQRDLVFIAGILASALALCSTFLIKLIEEYQAEELLLLITAFIVAGITGIVLLVNRYRKKWQSEEMEDPNL